MKKTTVKRRTFRQFEKDLAAWADPLFGTENPLRPLRHLKQEVDEVIQDPTDKFEYADCLMLLIDAHRRAGLGNVSNLLETCYEKLEICKKRKWGKPDAQGIIRHIKG